MFNTHFHNYFPIGNSQLRWKIQWLKITQYINAINDNTLLNQNYLWKFFQTKNNYYYVRFYKIKNFMQL